MTYQNSKFTFSTTTQGAVTRSQHHSKGPILLGCPRSPHLYIIYTSDVHAIVRSCSLTHQTYLPDKKKKLDWMLSINDVLIHLLGLVCFLLFNQNRRGAIHVWPKNLSHHDDKHKCDALNQLINHFWLILNLTNLYNSINSVTINWIESFFFIQVVYIM